MNDSSSLTGLLFGSTGERRRCSLMSVTRFLLHINDILIPDTFVYDDDSTVADRYLSNAKTSMEGILSYCASRVRLLDTILKALSD